MPIIDAGSAGFVAPGPCCTIIVGSGPVGLAMAVELARAGREVLVLEAGGNKLEASSQEFFHAACSNGIPLPGLHHGRFRMLGGTSNFWGGQLVQFDPIVFEQRPWVTAAHWPISRSDLDPYYHRAYQLMGMNTPLNDEGIWQRLRQVPPKCSEELATFFTAWAPEPNFTQLFRKEISGNPRINVLINSPVISIKLDESGSRILSVTTCSPDGRLVSFSSQNFVLANGTIEIARLLMSPLENGQIAAWSNNPWLGHGYLDHVDCYAGEVAPTNHGRFHDIFDNAYLDSVKYVPKLKLSEAAQRKSQLLGIAGHFIFRSRIDESLAAAKSFVKSVLRGQVSKENLSVSNIKSTLSAIGVVLPMISRYMKYGRMYNRHDAGIGLRLTAEHAPLQKSRICLSSDRDSLGMPFITMEWRIPEDTINTMADFAVLVRTYLEENQLATVELDPALMDRDVEFLSRCDDANHHMGMARMSPTKEDGVVDRNLKVFGSENLYVAGAAVFPTSGFANPTLTGIALGLRLSAHILGRN